MRLGSRAQGLSTVLRLAEVASGIFPQGLKQAIYRLPMLSDTIRAQLNSFAPTGLTEVAVASGVLRGARLRLNLKSEKYYWLGNYEPQLIPALLEYCKPGMTVYDVGANIGYVSLAFSQVLDANGKVYAFEPLLDNAQ